MTKQGDRDKNVVVFLAWGLHGAGEGGLDKGATNPPPKLSSLLENPGWPYVILDARLDKALTWQGLGSGLARGVH